MRPEILFGLFAPISTLPHVGPKTAKLLERLCGRRILDVCWHLPLQIERRHTLDSLEEAQDRITATLVVSVGAHHPPHTRRQPYRVTCHDSYSSVDLVFFHAARDFLSKLLPPGSKRLISGVLEKKFGQWQMVHPHHVGSPEERLDWTGVRPLYPMTASLHKKTFSKAMEAALQAVPNLPEWLSKDILDQYQWGSWKEALLTLHNPQKAEDIEPTSSAHERLAFDELLAHQLLLKLTKDTQGFQKGKAFPGTGRFQESVREKLPFSLTNGQEDVLQDIRKDLESEKKMVRLLQGDVGSGKTLVAFMAMLHAVESNHQAVFLAPTEILAQQQYRAMEQWCKDLPINVGLFTGSTKSTERRENLERLQSGDLQIAVGTHALLEDDILFQNLGLVVIDEQHRFGVDQRSRLIEKDPHCNVLAMTATPIPRTMALTLYGEIDISSLREKPAYRQPIDTRVMPLSRMKEVYQGMQRILAKGEQIYWVCPLVEESEALNLGHVEARFGELKSIFQDKVAFLHGRLKAQEKETVMAEFKAGNYQVLVSTTVIEVGVDVPNATVMVIEHAERFGLFQLHQLRGRVGRGDKPSSCLLLYDAPLNTTGRERLKTLRESNDGFKIAEKDLKLRGSGDLLGTRQSGLPSFRFFNFNDHGKFVPLVNTYSQDIIKNQLFREQSFHEALKCLLYLFNHEQAVVYLKSG